MKDLMRQRSVVEIVSMRDECTNNKDQYEVRRLTYGLTLTML